MLLIQISHGAYLCIGEELLKALDAGMVESASANVGVFLRLGSAGWNGRWGSLRAGFGADLQPPAGEFRGDGLQLWLFQREQQHFGRAEQKFGTLQDKLGLGDGVGGEVQSGFDKGRVKRFFEVVFVYTLLRR